MHSILVIEGLHRWSHTYLSVFFSKSMSLVVTTGRGKLNFNPSCTHKYLSRGMMLLLIQVSPDVHVKCKEINRPAFPKVLVRFLQYLLKLQENGMSMTKSLDSVNRYLYYAITGTLRLIFRLSIQKEVNSKDSQTSQAWATSTACYVGWRSLHFRVENAGIYLDISLPNIFVSWDSIIIIKLHLLNQYIRYRVFTRKAKIQGNRIQEWHQ